MRELFWPLVIVDEYDYLGASVEVSCVDIDKEVEQVPPGRELRPTSFPPPRPES